MEEQTEKESDTFKLPDSGEVITVGQALDELVQMGGITREEAIAMREKNSGKRILLGE